MAEKRLTQKAVDALKPPTDKTEVAIWDPTLGGFGVRALRSGFKGYTVMYRNRAGTTRRISLGSTSKFTLAEARAEARQILAGVARGADPAAEREAARKVDTFRELAERYIKEHAEAHKKPRSIAEDRRLLAKIILPEWGKKPVDAITRQEVSRLHHRLRVTPIQANRVLALTSKLNNLAEAWGLRPDGTNPCRHVQRYRENKRERFLSDEEFSRLGEVLRTVEESKSEWPPMVTAIRLLIFTGCRLSEILNLKWDDVSLETGTLLLPDSKTGRKRVLLGAAAVEVLENAFRMEGNPYVCPGARRGRPLVGLQHVWERIRKEARIEDVRLHDLRHSFASVGASGGMSLPVLGALLGHSQAQTTQRYAHLSADPIRRAVEEIGAKIAAAMNAKPKEISLEP